MSTSGEIESTTRHKVFISISSCRSALSKCYGSFPVFLLLRIVYAGKAKY